jgi:hypothetical protein
MAHVDLRWSLAAILHEFRPHEHWRAWFSEAYAQAMESAELREQLQGWRAAAIILGDMHACLLCLLVCHYGRSLLPPDSRVFLDHMDLCLWEMGLATPTQPGEVLIGRPGEPETFQRDEKTAKEWLAIQMQPFNGDLKTAAEFAMRFAAVRLGLLQGPTAPTLKQLMDASQWRKVGGVASR